MTPAFKDMCCAYGMAHPLLRPLLFNQDLQII